MKLYKIFERIQHMLVAQMFLESAFFFFSNMMFIIFIYFGLILIIKRVVENSNQ